MKLERYAWTCIILCALIYAGVVFVATLNWKRAVRAEQYSEHLAQELRLCEEGKGKR